MDRTHRIATLLIVGLAFVLGLWFGLREPRSVPAEPAGGEAASVPAEEPLEGFRAPIPGPEAPVALAEVEPHGAMDAGVQVDVAGPDGVRVLSSSGLPLPFIDWRSTGGAWTRVPLAEDGRMPVHSPAPCELRAPGHGNAELEPGISHLVLDPDVLFVVRAPDLRRCMHRIDVDDPYLADEQRGTAEDRRRPEIAVWGFVSDSEWVVALSAEGVLRELGQPELRIMARLRDGRRLDAEVRATSGNRGSWDVPCAEGVAASALRVAVERIAGDPRGSVRVQLLGPDLGHDAGWIETYPWGRVWHAPTEFIHQKAELAADQDELEFELVPQGIEITVLAQDLESKAYGRTLIVHDDAPCRVRLIPPLRVTGRLLDLHDGTPLTRAALAWNCRVDGDPVFGWTAEAHDAELASDGSFALTGPMSPPGNPSMPLDPPGDLWLRVEAPGYQPLELERDLDGARDVDVGELQLVRRVPELVLAPGHGLRPEQVDWTDFEIAGQPGRGRNVRWGRLVEDGALELHLLEEEVQPSRPSRTPPDWSTAHALILYVQDDAIPVRAFERDPDGRYAAVELHRHELVFGVEPSASERNWLIGWEWKGLFAVCAGFTRPEAGENLKVVLHAPAQGAQIAWMGRGPNSSGERRPTDLAPLRGTPPAHVLR
jgi:hypothetical protein